MTTKELIQKLQELDPGGNLYVAVGDTSVKSCVSAQREKNYLDGEPPYQEIIMLRPKYLL